MNKFIIYFIFLFFPSVLFSQTTVKLFATPHTSLTDHGHTYIVITHFLKSGSKEEAYGFYPVKKAPIGKGEVRYELSVTKDKADEIGKMLGKSHEYINMEVNQKQLSEISKLINEYNRKDYNFVLQNCVSFVNSVCKIIGLKTPASSNYTYPDSYLNTVKALNPESALKNKTIDTGRKLDSNNGTLLPETASAGWTTSKIYPHISFRAKFDHYNEYSAKKGKPANEWNVFVKNSGKNKISLSWQVTDVGQSPKENNWRRHCIESGKTYTSGLWFTNATNGGSVSVWFRGLKDCDY